jgi:hypothetical protein
MYPLIGTCTSVVPHKITDALLQDDTSGVCGIQD